MKKEWERQNPDKVEENWLPKIDFGAIARLHGIGVPKE